nr:MAG TPA: hypothetical protein [Caudoviricetes sp.]
MSSVNFTVFLPCGWYSSKPDSSSNASVYIFSVARSRSNVDFRQSLQM